MFLAMLTKLKGLSARDAFILNPVETGWSSNPLSYMTGSGS